MPSEDRQVEALKFILENALHPERLDEHPWARSLLAGQAGQGNSPGQRLVAALTDLFAESRPSVPPRQGKRLDTRWGEFGLLAAQYFAPIRFGLPTPASLREAWGRIDQSILLFVYEDPDHLTPAERDTYKLVADEPEVAAYSTLSDWHRKGLQRLLQAVQAREAFLSQSLALPAVIQPDGSALDAAVSTAPLRKPGRWGCAVLGVVFLLLAALLLAGAWKAQQWYQQALLLRDQAYELRELMSSSSGMLERARQAGPALASFRSGFLDLKSEVEPFLWAAPMLGWVPEYGGELTASPDLLTYADHLLAAADLSARALRPILEQEDPFALPPQELVRLLSEAGPQLAVARSQLDLALSVRQRLDPQQFSPRVQTLLLEDLDPLTAMMQDGLMLAVELPRALGASGEGPKTYLLLAQNEDELRPTGGFITAAGTILVQDGRISQPVFRNSGFLEDWSKPYPAAPWQLRDYMNSPVLVFRDATWFTDYRVTALYAEQLYAYVSDHSVDGVIAFDQLFLVKLLTAIGPLQVEGKTELVTAENVIDVLRRSKFRPADDTSPDWDDKAFLTPLASALLEKILSGDVDWERLTWAILDSLAERNLLIQVDNPALAAYAARQGWDGAVQPGDGDFLLVADSNVGFNKTNAVVETSLEYEVDLRSLVAPVATLSVTHTNNAEEMFTCTHWGKERPPGESDYPITDCYWDYMRVYRPAGTELLDSVAQFIPANWILTYKSVPPRVDILDDEEIAGVQAFGTLKIVPGGHSRTTLMKFALPLNIFQLQPQSGQVAYRLRVQKQPGTHNIPILVRVLLPDGAVVGQIPSGAVMDGSVLTYQTRLRTDLFFELLFLPPQANSE